MAPRRCHRQVGLLLHHSAGGGLQGGIPRYLCWLGGAVAYFLNRERNLRLKRTLEALASEATEDDRPVSPLQLSTGTGGKKNVC